MRFLINAQDISPHINYNEKGQRSDIHYGNGSKTRYEYDKNTFRLIRLFTNRNDNNNDENVLQDIHYTYDPVGNIVEIVDNAQQYHYFSNSVIEPRAMYKYDALYRLIEATGRELSSLQLPTHSDFANNIPVPNQASNAMLKYTHEYSYDHLGNILQMKAVNNWTRNYVYDEATNRLLKHDEGQTLPDYTYDEHGNITKMPHLQSMHYDYKDQLNKVVLDASENMAYYIYDANGQRVRKVVVKGNVKEERIYVGSYERYIKTENGSQTIERISVSIAEVAEEPRGEEDNSRAVYHIDLNKRIALIEYIEGQSPTIRYQLGNHLGSVSLELNATGQIISYEEFHPFGTTSYRSGTNETEVSLKRYKYIGKERDEETGLYYYGARYYAAWIGRFVSVDPLADKYLNLSPYVYVADNPIKYIDPDGKDWKDIEGNTLSNEQLKNVKVYIFYQPGGSDVDGFGEQTKKQYEYFVSKYGEGAVAVSTGRTNDSFIKDWENISGTDVREVWMNYHGDAATVELPEGVMSSAGSKTNETRRDAVDILKLPFPKGNISKANLQINSCNAADEGMFGDGSLTIAQAFSKRFQENEKGFAKIRAARGGVSFWSNGQPFSYFSWVVYNKPALKILIEKEGNAVNFLLKYGLDPR